MGVRVISTLPIYLTQDLRPIGQVSCRWANALDELTLVRLIYNSAMIVLALSEIFRGRWEAKKGGGYLRQELKSCLRFNFWVYTLIDDNAVGERLVFRVIG